MGSFLPLRLGSSLLRQRLVLWLWRCIRSRKTERDLIFRLRGTVNAYIQIKDATLRFRIYRNRTPALKETVIAAISGKKGAGEVLEFDALKNINLTLNGGDRLGIISLNGAGKSTLLKAIVGIYPPQKGSISVRGK